jgi:outer membrane lipoprotein carrier protein
VEAVPKSKEGTFQSVRIGFKGRDLSAVEITDSFGQRSLLQFTEFRPNAPVSPELFRFSAPKGADVIEQ